MHHWILAYHVVVSSDIVFTIYHHLLSIHRFGFQLNFGFFKIQNVTFMVVNVMLYWHNISLNQFVLQVSKFHK